MLLMVQINYNTYIHTYIPSQQLSMQPRSKIYHKVCLFLKQCSIMSVNIPLEFRNILLHLTVSLHSLFTAFIVL